MEHKNIPFEVKQEDIKEESGVFSGYGSTFGGKPDSYGDVIAAGAFADTLAVGGRNGTGVKMLFQHDASMPVGVWTTLEENKKGLKVEGQLAMKTQLGAESYELMKLGAIDGLSIGFEIEEYEVDEKRNIRTLKKINLWEISLVTFPANTRATITQVKSVLETAKTPREFEKGLRELGLSNEAAIYITSLCKDSLRESRKSPVLLLSESLKKINNVLGKEA